MRREHLTGGFDAPSESCEELCKRLGQFFADLGRVELRFRDGAKPGRTRATGIGWAVEPEDSDASALAAEVVAAAERLEADSGGTLHFQAVLIFTAQDRAPVKVAFQLDDESTEEAAAVATASLMRVLRGQSALLERSLAAQSKLVDQVMTLAAASHGSEEIELRKLEIKLAHDLQVEKETAEDRSWEQQVGLVREIAPKIVAVQAAKAAQKERREAGDAPRPAWRHGVTAAELVLAKVPQLDPQVRDVLESLAAATTREEAADCFAALRTFQQEGKFDPFAWLAAVPELLPLLPHLQT